MKTTYSFQYRGREWQLIKRGTGRRAPTDGTPWSYRLTVGGKRVLISTRTAHTETAVALAKARIAAVLDGRVEVLKVDRAKTGVGKLLTVGEACDLYKAANVVRPATARDNVSTLKRLVVVALGIDDADDVSLDRVDGALGELFLAKCQGKAKVNRGAVLRVNAGANSRLRQAQSVFAKRHRRIFDGCQLGGVDSFCAVKPLKVGSHRYVPLEDGVLRKLDEAAERVRGSELWVVNRLIRLCGLRDSEVVAAKTDWLTEHNGRLFLEIVARPGEFIPKGHEGRVMVPSVLEPVFRERKAAAEEAGEPAFLVRAENPTARHNLVYREHSKWVREFLPGRQKTNHELRKHAGSLVAQKFNSWEAAARFLREDLETAKSHYLELLKPVGLEVEDLLV